MWDQLPAARQRSILGELREAMRELKAAGASGPTHGPLTCVHSHPHYSADGSGRQHTHLHEHDGDADHGHSHADLDAAVESAERAKRSAKARPTIMNAARRAAVDDSWARLARTATEIERKGRR
jgi:hypothetical protein